MGSVPSVCERETVMVSITCLSIALNREWIVGHRTSQRKSTSSHLNPILCYCGGCKIKTMRLSTGQKNPRLGTILLSGEVSEGNECSSRTRSVAQRRLVLSPPSHHRVITRMGSKSRVTTIIEWTEERNLCWGTCPRLDYFIFLPSTQNSSPLIWLHITGGSCTHTHSVWMDFRYSNVPLANDCKLLSYRDNKLRLCRSRNASRRMHSISLAFNRSNCRDANPLKTPLGRSLILFPYKTLRGEETDGCYYSDGVEIYERLLTEMPTTWVQQRHHEPPERCYCWTNQYAAVDDDLQTLSGASR